MVQLSHRQSALIPKAMTFERAARVSVSVAVAEASLNHAVWTGFQTRQPKLRSLGGECHGTPITECRGSVDKDIILL